jgi:hypothetical protein
VTRSWAEQVSAAHPHLQGFLWSSRQDDRALAVVLFGSRVQASDIVDGKLSRPLIKNGVPEDLVLQLATTLKVGYVDNEKLSFPSLAILDD